MQVHIVDNLLTGVAKAHFVLHAEAYILKRLCFAAHVGKEVGGCAVADLAGKDGVGSQARIVLRLIGEHHAVEAGGARRRAQQPADVFANAQED